MTGLLILIQPQTWVYEPPSSYNPAYYDDYTYDFVLTGNESEHWVSFYTNGLVINSILTNNTPISLSLLSGGGIVDRFTGVTAVRERCLAFRSGSYNVQIFFTREEADAVVNVSLRVEQLVTVTGAAPLVVIPTPLIGATLGGCLLALYRLLRIEKHCRMLLAVQSRWSAWSGLVLVILLIVLTAFMLAPHLGNVLGGAYREVQRTSTGHDLVPFSLTLIDPTMHVNLTAIHQDPAVQDVSVLAFRTDTEVAIELYQEELMLLELHVASDLNSSHFELPTLATDMVVRRVIEDADVSFDLSLQSVITEIPSNPVPYAVLMASAIAPFSVAVFILKSVRSRLQNGSYDVSVANGVTFCGPDIE